VRNPSSNASRPTRRTRRPRGLGITGHAGRRDGLQHCGDESREGAPTFAELEDRQFPNNNDEQLEECHSGASSINEDATYTLYLASNNPDQVAINSWTITWGDGSAPQLYSGNPSSEMPVDEASTAERNEKGGALVQKVVATRHGHRWRAATILAPTATMRASSKR
jgi:hypothetical protein